MASFQRPRIQGNPTSIDTGAHEVLDEMNVMGEAVR